LYDVYSKLFKLRNTSNYLSTFTTGSIAYNLTNAVKWLSVTSDSLKVMVYGNFDVNSLTASVTFPSTGTWYSFLNDSVATITSTNKTVTLPPGAYYVFTNKNIKDIVLPVNLLSFTAQKTEKNTVLINWSTSNETNNQYFEVQRSTDGNTFTTIGKVAAVASQYSVKQYQFTDALPISGTNYYRLKQVDKDGQVHYTSIIKISIANGIPWQLYPNPAAANTALYIRADVTNLYLTLTDVSGKVLWKNMIKSAASGQQIALPLQQLSKGIYLLKVSADKGNSTLKLVVQ